MSPERHLRQRTSIVLHMVMAFVVMILLAQLWFFTVVLETMETHGKSDTVELAAILCSLMGCGVVWILIRYYMRMEKSQ